MGFMSFLKTNKKLQILENDALSLSKEIAKKENWPWLEPVRINLKRPFIFGKPYWEVYTNSESHGSNVVVCIDATSSVVINKNFLKR